MCIWAFLVVCSSLVRPGSPQQVVSEAGLHRSHWARQANRSHGGSSKVGQMIQRIMIDQARIARWARRMRVQGNLGLGGATRCDETQYGGGDC